MRARRNRQERKGPGRTPSVRHPTVRAARLAARVAELEAELRARDDFLAVVAHELRNPMTPISARLELLVGKARDTGDATPPGLVQGLEALERLVNAYLRRATLFLEAAHIGSGRLRLRTAEVDLSSLVQRVATNMLPLAEGAGCPFRIAVADGVAARCDAVAVEQILENLLSNAIRYGSGHPIEIAFAGNGQMAELSVRDQGIGIADCDQPLIFERFRQSQQTKPTGGFGVGLWVTGQLVRAMHGDIHVSSSPGAGSIFTATWPLWPADAENG